MTDKEVCTLLLFVIDRKGVQSDTKVYITPKKNV